MGTKPFTSRRILIRYHYSTSPVCLVFPGNRRLYGTWLG